MSCDFSINDELQAEPESFLPEYEEKGELGTFCYLETSESTAFSDYSENACEESDGSWGIEAPEGIFSKDHPDEQSMAAPYSWLVFAILCRIVPNTLSISLYTVAPGAIYPPPQF